MTFKLKLVANNSISQGISAILAMIFAIFAARYLSLMEYGELRYVMTLLPLLMAITLPGFDSIILRNTILKKKVNLWSIFIIRSIFGICGGLIIILYLYIYQDSFSHSLFFYLTVTAFFLPLFETATGYKNFLIGNGLKDQSINRVLLTRITSLILFCVGIYIIYINNINGVWVFVSYLISVTVPTLITFFLFIFRVKLPKYNNNYAIITQAIVITFSSFIFTFSYSIDKLFINLKFGAEVLAQYAILVMIPQEIAKLIDATIPLFIKKSLYGGYFEKIKKIKNLYLYGFTFFLSYIILFYLFSPIIFGEKYKYNLITIIISSFLIISQSIEYFNMHNIFMRLGPRDHLLFSIINVCVSFMIIYLVVQLTGYVGIIVVLIFKQLLLAPAYFKYKFRQN